MIGASLDPNTLLDVRPYANGREPCPRCATRGDIGCRHQRAAEPAPQPELTFVREQIRPSRDRRFISEVPTNPQGLEAEVLAFIARFGMSRSAFCTEIGQSVNWRNGFFVKARENRLKPQTIAKARAFMLEYAEERRTNG